MTYEFKTTSNGNIQTSQNGQVISTGTPDAAATQYGYAPPVSVKAATSTPSVLSSQAGADKIGQQTKTLNQLSAVPVNNTTPTGTGTGAPADATKTKTTTTPATPTSITLINPNTDQTITYNDASINKENIQGYLNSGYQLSEASGQIPNWMQPSGTTMPQTDTQKAQAAVDTASADLKTLADGLTKFTVSDADLAQQVSGITALWDTRIADMNRVNQQREGSINTLGIRLGSRYAGGKGGTFGGIISEEERQGVQRVSELEGQKQAAIAAAKTAAMTQNWSVYSKQVDVAQEAYKNKVTALKDLQTATAAQNKAIADALAQQEKDQYDRVTKPINDVLSDATKNGLNDPATMSAIQNSKTVGEAMALAGDYLQTGTGDVGDYLFAKRTALQGGTTPPTFDNWKSAQDKAKLDTEIAKIKLTEGIRFNYSLALEKAKAAIANAPNPDYHGEFQNTIKLAAGTGSTKDQRSAITSNLQDFIANGDYDSAYAQITQSVGDKLKGNASTKFSEALSSQTVLADLKKAMSDYQAANGDMSIFKGKEDQIQTKIGALMTNPKFAALATQLDSAFFQYRQNMTGAAFGADESAEYASVLPNKGNTLNLNLAKLEGANAYLNSQINGSISSIVGNGGVLIREKAQANNEIKNVGVNSKKTVDTFIGDHPHAADTIANLYKTPGVTDEDVAGYIVLHPELSK